jgi:hypothetical protein
VTNSPLSGLPFATNAGHSPFFICHVPSSGYRQRAVREAVFRPRRPPPPRFDHISIQCHDDPRVGGCGSNRWS